MRKYAFLAGYMMKSAATTPPLPADQLAAKAEQDAKLAREALNAQIRQFQQAIKDVPSQYRNAHIAGFINRNRSSLVEAGLVTPAQVRFSRDVLAGKVRPRYNPAPRSGYGMPVPVTPAASDTSRRPAVPTSQGTPEAGINRFGRPTIREDINKDVRQTQDVYARELTAKNYQRAKGTNYNYNSAPDYSHQQPGLANRARLGNRYKQMFDRDTGGLPQGKRPELAVSPRAKLEATRQSA